MQRLSSIERLKCSPCSDQSYENEKNYVETFQKTIEEEKKELVANPKTGKPQKGILYSKTNGVKKVDNGKIIIKAGSKEDH